MLIVWKFQKYWVSSVVYYFLSMNKPKKLQTQVIALVCVKIMIYQWYKLSIMDIRDFLWTEESNTNKTYFTYTYLQYWYVRVLCAKMANFKLCGRLWRYLFWILNMVENLDSSYIHRKINSVLVIWVCFFGERNNPTSLKM